MAGAASSTAALVTSAPVMSAASPSAARPARRRMSNPTAGDLQHADHMTEPLSGPDVVKECDHALGAGELREAPCRFEGGLAGDAEANRSGHIHWLLTMVIRSQAEVEGFDRPFPQAP